MEVCRKTGRKVDRNIGRCEGVQGGMKGGGEEGRQLESWEVGFGSQEERKLWSREVSELTAALRRLAMAQQGMLRTGGMYSFVVALHRRGAARGVGGHVEAVCGGGAAGHVTDRGRVFHRRGGEFDLLLLMCHHRERVLLHCGEHDLLHHGRIPQGGTV